MVDVDKCVSSTSSFIEKLWLFILIDFTSITLCNSFINESSALLIIVTSVLIVCLKECTMSLYTDNLKNVEKLEKEQHYLQFFGETVFDNQK